MRGSRDAMRDARKSGAIEAWEDGCDVQVRKEDEQKWETYTGTSPAFTSPAFVWRPKPEIDWRAWKPGEAPVGFIVRPKPGSEFEAGNRTSWWQVWAVNGDLVFFGFLSSGSFTLQRCFADLEHSTDGGKSWKPCGVMEGGE